MDRFTTYLLAGMAVLLATAASIAYFSRPQEAADPSHSAPPIPSPARSPSPFSPPTTAANVGQIPVSPGSPLATPSLLLSASAPTSVVPAAPTPVPWTPVNPGQVQTLVYPGFTVVYSLTLGNPLVAQYAMVGGAKPKRYPPAVAVKTPNPRLITAAGYSRAQMALGSSIGLYFGKTSVPNTELMTNIAPMAPACLQGPWAQFGPLEARWAGEFGWIEIVAGTIFASPPTQVGGIVIPVAFFRAYRRSYGDALAFIIPQTASGTDLKPYLTSIATIEAATGMDIFPNTLDLSSREQVAPAVW